MNVQDKILAAQTALLWDHPFFGVLMLQLKKVGATDDPRIDTMATDGRHLYYHEPFVMSLKKDELVFVLAHEVMHNALEHHIRRQHRKPGRWNKAADYAINGELSECKVGKMPDCGLLEPRFTGLSAEEIYRILDDENNGDDSDEGQGDVGGCGGTLDGCAPHDEAAKAELRAEIQTQIRQAAMTAKAAQAGKLPAGVQRIIDELLMPRVDWRSVLRRFIDESMTRNFSWSNPNRRMIPFGIVTPGTVSDGVSHIVIAVDTSGSIDAEILKDFAAEVNGAFQEGAVDRLTVIYADAAVAKIEEFENGDELVLHPAGGGGTAFSDTFEKITDQYPDARATIYLTDMYVFDFGEEPPMPVLWGVYGRDSKDFATLSPPFGETINISI
ncbi:VWA-like domain-containing protein [Rhizobium sp. SSA_523]|uniref:vWA domain-containing protein n=1 Tax=Rhizobium sp. SSA_523 TaxID=2952477 RepID=UPI0020910DA4|nr:VWA-like domain-containing protein [Rhizobium sp. SSA_523]MCO5730110.1 VWA-like domain-containing protein [Rhizobium sp. SSA_523]WKC25175.1 VWA-like domain-containing protein [Rhizobium sp. SSA_523]